MTPRLGFSGHKREWGFCLALGYPIGFSLGGSERVGYCPFLGDPSSCPGWNIGSPKPGRWDC